MGLVFHYVNASIRQFLQVTCEIHHEYELEKIPSQGPLILLVNHVNFLEAPLLFSMLESRPLQAWAKEETWRNPFIGFLANHWGAISIRRGTADRQAFNLALDALKSNGILAIAPEGTRSGDGRLQKGKSGAALLAMRTGVPLLPLVHYGGEHYWKNLRRLRRTDVFLKAGNIFMIRTLTENLSRAILEEITEEIMVQLASLLPEDYQGVYKGVDFLRFNYRYLQFLS